MALAPSMRGGGVVSGGSDSPTEAVSVMAAGLAEAPSELFVSAGLLCEQAQRPATIKQNMRPRTMLATVPCSPCHVLMSYCDDLAAASRRARLRLGCTSQATAMLTTYSATMGAAKMHMFRMSVVGVTMAAMMKMIRME